MIDAEEQRLFQIRLAATISHCLAIHRISSETMATRLGIGMEQWQQTIAGVEPLTAYQVYQCASIIGTSVDQLIPDTRVIKADIITAIARQVPADLFEVLYHHTVALWQRSASHAQHPPPAS
jgi:hypothetical protein